MRAVTGGDGQGPALAVRSASAYPTAMRMWLLSSLLVFGVACGGEEDDADVGKTGKAVGGACEDDGGCASGSRCLTEGDFPGGMCVIECDGPEGCPSGSHCTSNESGICLPACENNDDCRTQYKCDDVSNEGADGESMVCKNDS